MVRRNYRERKSENLAIGIRGYRSSLCGAVKRFQRRGKQWDGVLSLKEQCGRHIALLKNEQLKCFINTYLSPALFEYVTKDIFNLQRQEFTSNYPNDTNLCENCSLGPEDPSKLNCSCPRMKTAIRKINKNFLQRMNNKDDEKETNELIKFKLVYRTSTEQSSDWDEYDDSTLYFLYLLPCKYYDEVDTYDREGDSVEVYRFIDNQVTTEDKLLFVDVMRFFGGFHTDQEQPQLILHPRHEVSL